MGDIESLPFLEALRQMELEDGHSNTLFIHVTLAPMIDVVGEQKTKPTQHSVQELRRIGIRPDILTVRCKTPLTMDTIHKISLFASVKEECVISCHDTMSIYKVPEVLENQGMLKSISNKFTLKDDYPKWSNWKAIAKSFCESSGLVRIAVVGKYVTLQDSYVSIYHALLHAGANIGRKVQITWIDSEDFDNVTKHINYLEEFDGILVPGGFGRRGSDGIINTANFARARNIPYLGICFGFQLAIIAFARNVCNIRAASSTNLIRSTKIHWLNLCLNNKQCTIWVEQCGLANMKLQLFPIHRLQKYMEHILSIEGTDIGMNLIRNINRLWKNRVWFSLVILIIEEGQKC